MDELVIAAIARWPNVPAVHGWLQLSSRGQWRIKGEPISNRMLLDFIGRNYAADEHGRWYFQNGPQRVFVTLEATPWIWRVRLAAGCWELRTHTDVAPRQLLGVWLDEGGRIFLNTDLGFGLVESVDATRVVACFGKTDGSPVEADDFERWLAGGEPPILLFGPQLSLDGDVPLGRLRAADTPRRFGFVRTPLP